MTNLLPYLETLPPGILPLFFFVIGTCIGSFVNVCIFRLPRKESIVFPASHCMSCGTKLKATDNIPLLSFLFLGRRCRYCKSPIAWQYPMVEFITGLLFALSIFHFGWSWYTLIACILIPACMVVSVIDLKIQIIPNEISLPGIVLGLLINILPASPLGFLSALYGMLLGGGFFYLVALLSKGGMGGGDIKLIAMFGAFLGWKNCLVAIFFGVLLGSVVGIVLMLLRKKGRKDPIPFGPFLCLGTLIALFFGNQIIYWYLHFSFI